MGFGLWKCIIISNVFVIVGAGLTLVPNFEAFLVGRFLYGVACGGFSCFCPKFISEVSPTEVKGPAGALSQICITFGILVPFSIGVGFGIPVDPEQADIDKDYDQLCINVLFMIPIILAVI
jgi:MFS family permease